MTFIVRENTCRESGDNIRRDLPHFEFPVTLIVLGMKRKIGLRNVIQRTMEPE